MPVIKQNSEPFQPYARLLNVIGDQLITDKKVAVIELIKNCYDADATSVTIRFKNSKNFGLTYLTEKEQPYIEIEDNGEGMSLETITNVWLRPATPNKLDKKKAKLNLTERGRIIQGEKGIGRFAIHKLGEKIELFSKYKNMNEVKLEMDFTEFDPEKVDLFNQPKQDYKLLNEVKNNWYENSPPEVIQIDHGTLIRIYNLRESWKANDLEELYKSIQRLIPPIDENAAKLGIEFKTDFKVDLFVDSGLYISEEATTFKDVIERAQYTMIGEVNENGCLSFDYKSLFPRRQFEKKLDLLSQSDLSQNNYDLFGIKRWFFANDRIPKCGGFKFTFYAFDLSKPDKTILTNDLNKFIKDNFVFVLRDGVRVYPYGEKGVDWLNLDKLRATYRAGQFISYNDLTGFVYISQSENSKLKDSTNRQGIMDIDGALDDFKNLVTAVTEVFNIEIKIDKRKEDIARKKIGDNVNSLIKRTFNEFQKSLENIEDKDILEKANKFLDTVNKQTSIMKDRLEVVEDLAGLGMAVEKASHDALMILSKIRLNIKDLIKTYEFRDIDKQVLFQNLHTIEESLGIVYDEMQIIQPLFKIQRKAISEISLVDSIGKVAKYFKRDLDGKVELVIDANQDLIISTNQGLILQVLINLIDNALYWVGQTDSVDKKIIISINSKDKSFIISDNGPGIREDATPLIFDEFFSLKSNGRGLGLYIVKEILLRINSEISIVLNDEEKILPGANIKVKFNTED